MGVVMTRSPGNRCDCGLCMGSVRPKPHILSFCTATYLFYSIRSALPYQIFHFYDLCRRCHGHVDCHLRLIPNQNLAQPSSCSVVPGLGGRRSPVYDLPPWPGLNGFDQAPQILRRQFAVKVSPGVITLISPCCDAATLFRVFLVTTLVKPEDLRWIGDIC